MCQADHAVFVITAFVVVPSPTPKQRSFHLGDAIWRDHIHTQRDGGNVFIKKKNYIIYTDSH